MDYKRMFSRDVRVQRLAARICKMGNMKDLYSIAQIIGERAADIIENELDKSSPNGNISEADARAIVSPVLKAVHSYISELTTACLNKSYETAGVGLKALIPEYDMEMENDIVMEIVRGSVTDEVQ